MFWFVLILFLIFPKTTKAVSEFKVNQTINYSIEETGIASVKHQIELTNNFSQVYATNYQIKLSSSELSQISATDSSGNILADTQKNPNETVINLKFNQPALGKGKTNLFNLFYKIENLATAKGNTWEISLPETKNVSEQDTTEINIDLPSSFGNISFNSVTINEVTHFNNRTQVKIIPKNNSQKVLLIFGTFQLFDFDLDFYLNNTGPETKLFDLAIPPDTETQFINYHEFSPPFNKIYSDADGNWIIRYQLNPNQVLHTKVSGQAKITSANPQYLANQINHDKYISEDVYWPVNHPTIRQISLPLSSPKKIYDYVTSTLDYEYNAINSAVRKGALEALSAPNSSLCTEFTDLFITLARSRGIPAREIQGYAYTNNPKIKPVNINADILHAWPQYYDNTKNKWVSIDPTWGKTTNGIDYFSDLDLNHLTFVIHGQNSRNPLPPGSYKDNKNIKTVNVRFSDNEFTPSFIPPIINFKQKDLPWEQEIEVKNPNTHSLSGVILSSPQLKWVSEPMNLLPLETITLPLSKQSLLKTALPGFSQISFNINSNLNQQITETVTKKYPPHYLGLLVIIACSIFVLSLGGIIITSLLSKRRS